MINYFFSLGETFIEIGVQKGENADKIIKKWPSLRKYYGIDVWKHQEKYIDSAHIADSEQMKIYEQALSNLKNMETKYNY